MISSGSFGLAVTAFLAEQIHRGRVDVAVGQVRQGLVAGLLEPEIVGRGQQRGVGAVGLERGGAAADVGADRNPLHVAHAEAVGAEQRHGVVVRARRRSAPTAMRLPLSCLGSVNSFCAISANSPLFDELPISANAEASFELATMPCSSEWFTITA